MNQTILLNHGVLDIVFDLLDQEVDIDLLVMCHLQFHYSTPFPEP